MAGIITLIFSALFALYEKVLSGLSISRLRGILAHKSLEGRWYVSLWHRSPAYLTNTVMAGRLLCTLVFAFSILWLLDSLGYEHPWIYLLGLVAAWLILTVVSITFVSKFYPNNLQSAMPYYLPILLLFFILLFPFSALLVKLNNLLVKSRDMENGEDKSAMAEVEIQAMIEAGAKEGLFAEGERRILTSVLELRDLVVREVMTPRIDMYCINLDLPKEEIYQLIKDSSYSRIPVYQGKIDNIVGILYIRDIIQKLLKADEKLELEGILRQAHFVPETKKVKDLLFEFQREKIHIAMIVDEYGGIAGLVTIEDLLEEIVGEIQDEYDEEEAEFISNGDGSYQADAKISIDELGDLLNIEFPEGDFDTLGGFLFQQMEHIPQKGEELLFNGLKFIIIEADSRRIHKVGIKTTPESLPPKDQKDKKDNDGNKSE